jgi:uncharacterized protein (DUF3084 family)
VYSVAFILALLAFGGLAAYLGDVVGYRLGKRRVSLLHLRPRITARLVGILVGILIPLVTVGICSLLIPQVKDAVFRLDDLHREINNLQSERDTMAGQRDSLRVEAKHQRQAAELARADAQESRADLAKVRANLDSAKGYLADARSRVTQLRTQTQRLGAQRDEARKGLKEAEAAVKDAENALKSAEEELAKTRTQAETEIKGLQGERDRLRDEREALVAQADTLRQNLNSLRDQLTEVREEWELEHTIFALRRPILDIDTELVRAVVKRPADVDALTDELVALLVLADTAAETAGAGPGDKPGRYTRAVFPIPITWRPAEPSELPPEEAVLGVVRRQLWESEASENVVQVKVAARAFPGEQVKVRFEAQPNELVFRKGETIVARKLAPGLDEVGAFEQLWLLIADPDHSEVRRQAKAAGMLPNPKSGRYGEITIRELYAAAHECASRAEPATIKVQADDDTYTQGPLAIKITVEPSGG